MKKIMIMPDSFKGTMDAVEVCDIISDVIRKKYRDKVIRAIPMADGGEGTIDCFLYAFGGEKVMCRATDAYGKPKEAYYWKKGKDALVEVAVVAGFTSSKKNDPSKTTTHGVGELIKHAIAGGARHIIIAMGGSCTNDAGLGMIRALGVDFYDESNKKFLPTGGTLNRITTIDDTALRKTIKGVTFSAMCDIDNPLYGQSGAAYVFAPQKGADQAMVEMLDSNLRSLSEIIRQQIGTDVSQLPGAGAAGGMGAGAYAFLNAKFRQGVDLILDMVDFERELENCELVITGEGCLDSQSFRGKTVVGIARRVMKKKIPVIALVGCTSGNLAGIEDYGISCVIASNEQKMTPEELQRCCRSDLRKAAEKIAL